MAADTTRNPEPAADFEAHRRNYAGFINVAKWATLVVAIIALVVVLIIVN